MHGVKREHPQSARASIWQPDVRGLTLGLILVVVAGAFEALAVATVLPLTLRELGGLTYYGWTFSAFQLANVIGITLGGESDRVGISRLFLAGLALFCGGLALSGCAGSMPVIVLGRSLQGLGSGLLYTTAYAAISQAYTVDLQPRMLATLSSAWVVPGLVGPGLAGALAQQLSWRWVFLGLIPLTVLAALLALPALAALPRMASAAVSGRRLRLSAELALGALLALVALDLSHWVASLALAALGCGLCLRALRELFPTGTLSARPGQPAAVATMLLLTFSFFGAEAFVPLALSHVRHAPVWITGSALTCAALTWTTGAWLPVRLGARVPRRRQVRAGIAVLAIGLCATAALLWPELPPWAAGIAWGLSGLGMGLAFTTTSAAILEAAEPGESGAASAALQLAQVLGAALSTGCGGAIVASRFAGDPPVRGIASVDLLMLAACGLALLAARGITDAAPPP